MTFLQFWSRNLLLVKFCLNPIFGQLFRPIYHSAAAYHSALVLWKLLEINIYGFVEPNYFVLGLLEAKVNSIHYCNLDSM